MEMQGVPESTASSTVPVRHQPRKPREQDGERGPDFRRVRGVNFVRVRGTVAERARAHARILREEARTGAIVGLADKNEYVIRHSPGLTQWRPIADLANFAYRRLLLPWLVSRLPEDTRQVMRAVAEETGLPLDVVQGATFQADGLMLLSRLAMFRHLLPEYPPGAMLGCSSAVASSNWTRDGRLLACRNQDYPVCGPWEANTSVIFQEPSESDQIPHVCVTTAGVHTAGLTSMNSEGMTLFTHAHFGKRVSVNGLPVVHIGDAIIRKAKTLGQAVDIARKTPSLANWGFVVSSAKENDAVVIEVSPDKVRVQGSNDGFISHTNFFDTEEMQRTESLLCGAYVEDLKGRLCRLRELLERHRGRLAPEHMAPALGDHFDPYSGVERVYGNTVSVITTIKSTIFEPGMQRFWLSCRGESPMGLGEFLEVDVDRFWSQSMGEEGEGTRSIAGYEPRDARLAEGIRCYREAYRCFHVENHVPDYLERALEWCLRSIAAYPDDAHVWIQAGILAFRLKRFPEARRLLEEAGGRKLSPHVEGARALFLARCLDVAGEREAARELYARWPQTKEPKLRKALERGLRRPFRASEAARVHIDMQFPDVMEY
jgi:hypothetical protein